ncbi:hypothetical protein [Carboxylicivirga sp. N1Y90]|uniref:hypothetical protein n=1 Tax=Carboxylicivirga fragile TaxID=3417571 RepID=UPI003D337359|nr:hypothetical protein [Marinilabiliaceae bacterium N1Y90]
MITSRYDKDEDIVYVERHGNVDINDLVKYVVSLDHDFNHLNSLHIIDDLRNSTSTFKQKEYPAIIKEIEARIKRYDKVKCAVVVEKPKETALSILYKMTSKSIDKYTYETFSTLEAAKRWLKHPIQ